MNTPRQQAVTELLTRANAAKLRALRARTAGRHIEAESEAEWADAWLREAIRFAKRDAVMAKGGE